MARSTHGALRSAFEVTYKSDPKLALPKHAALVALCRLLSDQIDGSGEEATNRLTAAYLSALKDIERALADRSTSATSGTGRAKKTEGAGDGSTGSALGSLRSIRGGASA